MRINMDDELPTLDEIYKKVVEDRLAHCWGNKSKTAESLGITLKTLYNKLHRWGLHERYKKRTGSEVSQDEHSPSLSESRVLVGLGETRENNNECGVNIDESLLLPPGMEV